MRYVLGVLLLTSAILVHGVLVRAQDHGVTVHRAGIFCVFVGPTGIAVFTHEVYDHATYRLVPCPQIGDPGPMAQPLDPTRP